MPKTICQLLHSLNVGGAEILAARLGRELTSDSRRLVFFCLDEVGVQAESLQRDGFVVEFLGRKPGFDRACMRRIAELWRRYDVDVVQAHQYTPYFYAMAARGFLRNSPPILFTEHGRFFPDLPNWKHQLFSRWMISRRDRVVAVGKSVAEAIVHNEGIPAQRVEVIYNGVSEQQFLENRLDAAQKVALRASLGVSERSVVLMVARLDTIKDHPMAIRAMDELRKRAAFRALPLERQPILLFAGGGPEAEKLQTLVAERGLESYVRFLGERRDVSALLQIADVFLLTSLSEGIPLTILEAFASETPVVATCVGGIPEVVQDGQTGSLVPAGCSGHAADALEQLLTNVSYAETVRQNARRVFLERFTERKMLSEYARILSEMMD